MPVRRTTAGDRSHTVTIQAPAGTLLDTDSDVEVNVPAAIAAWPISAQPRENQALGGIQNQTNYTVNVGYRTDVQPAFVVLEQCCTQRRFQIVAVIPTDRRDALDMTCVTNG